MHRSKHRRQTTNIFTGRGFCEYQFTDGYSQSDSLGRVFGLTVDARPIKVSTAEADEYVSDVLQAVVRGEIWYRRRERAMRRRSPQC